MDEEINTDYIKKIKDKLFSKEKVTKGEMIQIALVLFLILLMLIMYFSTTCSLECSMCEHTGQTLIQRGLT